MSKHVVVLMGGWAAERPVSLKSGEACARALESVGYRVTRLDVTPGVVADLQALKPDVAFNALHGPFGEDGCMQGILEMLRLPYTHSGVLASALAMRKDRAKIVAAASGVLVAEGVTASRHEVAKRHVMEPPYVAKPVANGSSFGVFIVKEGRSHPPQELASGDWPLGDEMLVERFVPGRELTCAVIGEAEAIPSARRHRDHRQRRRILRLRFQIRSGRIDTRSLRRKLNQIFTKRFNNRR